MTETNVRTEAELEAGRLLFARPWTFLTSAAAIDQLPPPAPVELAFVGRSNVGKSSLINALTGRKGLARTSNTPGRTQLLNFFGAPDTPLVLVDMPGYGFAQAPKGMVDNWTDLIFAFLRGRTTLRRVFLLVDSRHGLKQNDCDAMSVLDKTAVSYQVVLTKADKITVKQLARVRDDVSEGIRKRPAAHPLVLATSSEKGGGIPDLRCEIADILSQ